jgi:hypothetical protein
MNQDRFIELLNLYLDEEISSEDLSDLMAETRSDPTREKVFVEYCRIHKACVQLGTSYGSRPARRSLRQTLYAIGGLAAAFVLLGMAGRNLMPFMGNHSQETLVVQQVESNASGLFFPDIAMTEVLAPRFIADNEEPRIRYMGSPSRGSPIWSNSPSFAFASSSSDGNRSLFSFREILKASNLELEDPFNGFSRFGETISIEFPKTADAPSSPYEDRFQFDSSLSLK